ncbi:MAG TPA: hypothetical protein VFA74_02410 [Terriglobales bacterium]|nr:hypothetical protein [Terriglobales bacterium]
MTSSLMLRSLSTKMALAVLVLLSSSAFAAHEPLPPELLQAKTVNIQNYSGQASWADGCYDELQKWGRFKIVSNPKDADLIFRLSYRVQRGRATIDIIQTSNHRMLWSDTRIWSVKSVVKELQGRIREEESAGR